MKNVKMSLLSLLVGFYLIGFPQAWHAAYAQAPNKDDVIVAVDGVSITRQDLEDAVSDRANRGYELNDPHQLRLLVLVSLIKEIIAEKIVDKKEISQTPALARKLDATRRGILLQSYLDKNLVPKEPTEPEIIGFISAHPEYFEKRKMYHYSQVAIEAKSAAMLQAIKDRLKLLAEHKAPTVQDIEMLLPWLAQNNAPYGYVAVWKQTDGMLPEIQKTLMRLDESDNKLDIQNNGLFFRVIALHDAYPDPLNPLWARPVVKQKLSNDSKEKQIGPLLNNLLSRAKVVLYDQSFKDLKIPTISTGVVEQKTALIERMYLAWNFALLIFAPVALYLFFRQSPAELQEYETRTLMGRVSDSIAFRVAVVLVLGAFLLVPAMGVLQAAYINQNAKTYGTMAAGGLGFGLAVVFLCVKIKRVKEYLSSGWLAVSALFVIQLCNLLLFE